MSTGVTGEYPYWPRDLVPRVIPDARVLTFGYDTHIRHSIYGSPPSQNRLLEHGGDFLCALEDCRRSNPSHPLLFIAHSLGGLVVKEALRQSKSYEQDQPSRALIYSSTKGIIFFGTPHLGADPLNAVHDCLVSVVKLLQFKVNDGIIQTLRPNSERLVILHEEFLRMTRTQNWRVHSFQEELPVPALSKKVVEDSSSCINERQHERTTHIRENHVDMCRFNDLDDPEFRKVEAALLFMRDSMQQKRPSITPKEREKILNKLKFESVGIRYMSVKAAQAKTCQWLLEGDVYNAWRDTTKLPDHHGFLWIKGKPGAGKSILMKYLLQEAKKTCGNSLVVSFFFNARGDRLEKSTEGMYRSLLIQLLQYSQGALSHRENIIPLMDMPDNKPWPLEVLKQAFRSVISQASSLDLCCYIDALDESSEDEIRDMVYFLEEIAEQALERNILFRVCFSSRHYPHISVRKGLELTLEDEPDHRGDIHQYVQSKLRIKEGNYRETVEQEILDRSDNIFLWAALVVDILNKEYDKGGDLTVRKRFQEIPNGLHDLFEDILTRDNEDMDKLILCLQWLLFSKRPLTSEELYFAIQSSMDPKASLLLNPEDVKSNRIDRFNLNASKGLVQISKRNPTVQFIHESVRDYLLREHGFRKLVEHHHGMGEDVEGTSNEILKLGCLNQLNHHEVAIPDDLFPELSNPESWRSNIHIIFPFYQYAVSNILGHADAAQGKGVCQINFMATFPRERWIKFDNIERYPSLGNKGDTSLIYLLAENNSANLIRNHPDRHLGFMQPASPRQHEFPIGAAIASGSHSVIRTLTIEAVKCSPYNADESLIGKIEQELSKVTYLRRQSNTSGKTPDIYTCLAILGSISLINLLWDSIKTSLHIKPIFDPAWLTHFPSVDFARRLIQEGADINAPGPTGDLALGNAVLADEVELADYLLSQGANLFLTSEHSRRPLLCDAMSSGMAETLVRHGKSPDTVSIYGLNCLQYYTKNDRPGPLRYILEITTLSVNSEAIDGVPLLSCAAQSGFIDVVRVMCTSGHADANLADRSGRTPLSYAAEKSNASMIECLFKSGALPNIADEQGRTPLHYAVSAYTERCNVNDVTVLKALLNHPSIDPNLRDDNGRTPFQKLINASKDINDPGCLLFLENARVDKSVKCKEGRTAISHAAGTNSFSILSLLLTVKFLDPDEPDFEGRTPLMYACDRNLPDNIAMLIKTGRVNVNARDLDGLTPLWHLITSWSSISESMKALLAGDIVDPLAVLDGETPLDFASDQITGSRDFKEAVRLLSQYVDRWVGSV